MKEQKSNSSKEKFSKESWKRALRAISKYAPQRYERDKTDCAKELCLAKKLEIKLRELPLTMDFLEKQGLIEYDKSETNLINLTPKGLDLALKVQNQRLTFSSNLVMASFAAIVVLISLVNLVNSNVSRIIVIVVLVFMWGLLYVFQENLK